MNTVRTQSPTLSRLARRIVAAYLGRYFDWRARACEHDAKHHDEAALTSQANAAHSRQHAARFRRLARRIS